MRRILVIAISFLFAFRLCGQETVGVEWRQSGDLYALFSADGKQITDYKYSVVCDFKYGVAAVLVKDACGLIDTTGKELVQIIYSRTPIPFGNSQFCMRNNHNAPLHLTFLTHPQLSSIWIDENGKEYKNFTKPVFNSTDRIPEELWDY